MYRVSGKKLTGEILNKIVSIWRIELIFSWRHPKTWRMCRQILTSTLNGCGLWPLAPVFEDSENGGAQPRRFIRHPLSGFLFILIRHPFQTYPKTVVPGHLRSGQVTLTPEMFVTLQKLRFFSDNMNIIRPSVPTKRSFSDFRFRWPKARSIFWHPYQKAMGETRTPLIYESDPIILPWMELYYIIVDDPGSNFGRLPS